MNPVLDAGNRRTYGHILGASYINTTNLECSFKLQVTSQVSVDATLIYLRRLRTHGDPAPCTHARIRHSLVSSTRYSASTCAATVVTKSEAHKLYGMGPLLYLWNTVEETVCFAVSTGVTSSVA